MSEKVIQTDLGGFFFLLPKITTFLKIKLLVSNFVATSFSLVHARSYLTPPATPMEFDFKFGDRQIKFII